MGFGDHPSNRACRIPYSTGILSQPDPARPRSCLQFENVHMDTLIWHYYKSMKCVAISNDSTNARNFSTQSAVFMLKSDLQK